MTHRSFTAAALAAAVVFSVAGCRTRSAEANAGAGNAQRVHARYVANLDSLAVTTERLLSAVRTVDSDSATHTVVRTRFAEARSAYKRVEYLLEYYDAESAGELNGPPIDEVDVADGPTIIEPAQGFQVLEGFLFPNVSVAESAVMNRHAVAIRDYANRARAVARSLVLNETNIFDAARIEIARIVTLGVTGFDSPAAHASLSEARAALEGVRDGLDVYRETLWGQSGQIYAALASGFTRADSMLAAGTFDTFDRLAFIVHYANPLARALDAARGQLGIALPIDPRLWRPGAPTLFEPGAFDSDYLRPNWSVTTTAARAELGRQLFFEPRLSGNGQRSCAFCHQPDRAFTDGRATSEGLTSLRLRNAPTLINAAVQGAQFSDLSVTYLEDQIAAVVRSPGEMHGELETSSARLRTIPAYVRSFEAAFGAAHADSVITPSRVRMALAGYIRSLTSFKSRFDVALRGDSTALDAEERMGFNVFAGKGLCATCHFIPLTGGTVPPAYVKTEQEVLGVPGTPVWKGARVDADLGRAAVTRAELHRFAFKTPSLRNVGLTAPYMHNGVYRTLEEVIRFYNVGGGDGIGIRLPNQTLPFDSLRLSNAESVALVRFLRTLTDTSVFSRAALIR